MAAGAPGVIVFSHANGFPAGTYRQLFEAWRAAGWTVHAIEKYGHDPRFPVTSNWPHLRAQLIDFIESRAGGPAWLVGHSLGGFLSLMAASRRPDLAAGVVMLDSPLIAGWKAQLLRLAKAIGLAERLSPGRVSRRRRDEWPSVDAAHAHFARKPIFAQWAPGALQDYISSGTEMREGAQRLSFDRAIETAIYTTLPDHLTWLVHRHPPRCPLGFVRGRDSREVRQAGMRATERLLQAQRGSVVTLPGSHLFPLEMPARTAATVLDLITRLSGPAHEPQAGGTRL